MAKLNLKNVPQKIQNMLFSYLKPFLKTQNNITIKRSLSYLGIRPNQINKNKANHLPKNQSIQVILSHLQKNDEIRRKFLQNNYIGITQLCCTQQDKQYIYSLTQDQSDNSNLSTSSKTDIKLMQLHKQITKHQQIIMLNYLKSIEFKFKTKKIEQCKQQQKKKKFTTKQGKVKLPFQNPSLFLLQNDIVQSMPLLSKPLTIQNIFGFEYNPILAEYTLKNPKKYQILIEQLKISLPQQGIARFNRQIDQFLIDKDKKNRKIMKQLLFSDIKYTNVHKIGNNKIKSTSQALKTLTTMKQLYVQSLNCLCRQQYQNILENIALLHHNANANQQDCLKIVEQILIQIEQLFKKKTKKLLHQQNIHLIKILKVLQQTIMVSSIDLIQLFKILTKHVQVILQQQNQQNKLLDFQTKIANLQIIFTFTEMFYNTVFTGNSIKTDSKQCQQCIIKLSQLICQFILICMNSLAKYAQFMQDNSNSIVNECFYLLKSMNKLNKIIQLRQRIIKQEHKVDTIDLSQIYQTTEYQESQNRIYYLMYRIFPKPTLQNYQQLSNNYSKFPIKFPIKQFYQIVHNFNQIVIQQNFDQKINQIHAKIVYGLIFQYVCYFKSLAPYEMQRNSTIFHMFINLANIYSSSIKSYIFNTQDDPQEIAKQFSQVLCYLILHNISFCEFSLKNILQLLQVMTEFQCFHTLNDQLSKYDLINKQKTVKSGFLLELIIVSNFSEKMLPQKKQDKQKIINYLLKIIQKYVLEQQSKQSLVMFLSQIKDTT